MKIEGGGGCIEPRLFTLALVGGELSGSRPGRFSAGERVPDIHRKGGWVGQET
jgi:hypothetical protein